ncbi:MAG: hypothetical protein QG603_99 [Patescibacteria group bacterium]|nr:hypothetical protein [Patescibacteria group bacterium]MDQ5970322.1 hypothetical protein [Patescibacteria group bacterium]
MGNEKFESKEPWGRNEDAESIENENFLQQACESIENEFIEESNGAWKKGDPVFIVSADSYDEDSENAGISWRQNTDIANEEFKSIGNALLRMSERIGDAIFRGYEVEVGENGAYYSTKPVPEGAKIKTSKDALIGRIRKLTSK